MDSLFTTEWAYLAGLIDGEGSIQFYARAGRSVNSYQHSISIWNTNLELINWVHERFGGSVHQDERGNNPNSNRYGHKPIHKVCWQGVSDLQYILTNVAKFLIIKRGLAKALLEFLITPSYEVEMRSEAFRFYSEVKNND